jgi:putative FmdB family regulatory protein
MPTYEYTCTNCGHTFDIVQSMSDEPLTDCPVCTGRLRKVFAPPAIAFRGSGFYATDHGKKAAKSNESGDGKPSTKPAKTGGGDKGSTGGPAEKGSGGNEGGDSSGSTGSDATSKGSSGRGES